MTFGAVVYSPEPR